MSPPILVVENEEDLAQSYERLLHLALPDGDGLDVVRSARRLPRSAPAIVVTAVASEAAGCAALEAGAADVLVKPFATDAFLAQVRRVLAAP